MPTSMVAATRACPRVCAAAAGDGATRHATSAAAAKNLPAAPTGPIVAKSWSEIRGFNRARP